jgi:molybdopterin-synthase adenylyltransferase
VSQREDRQGQPTGRPRVGLLEGPLTASSAALPVGATGGRRFGLRSSVDPLVVGEDIYLVRAGGDDHVIRGASDADRALLDVLSREPLALADLTARFGPAVRDKLDALDAVDALIPGEWSVPLDPEDAERFSRQQPYLAELGDPPELQRRLGRAHVTVVGVGGLGTWAVASLAAAGVRGFRLVDDDTVEPSNLNRQAMFRLDQVGTPKVAAAAAWLRAFDPRISVEPLAARVDGPPTVAGTDVLVLTADQPPYELGRWINAACVDAGVPFITAGQLPPLIRVGPLYIPGRTACFACHETALRADAPAYDAYVAHVQATPSRAATLGPTSAIAGSTLALEVMHLLLGSEPATAGAALTIDIRTLAVTREAIPRDAQCSVC